MSMAELTAQTHSHLGIRMRKKTERTKGRRIYGKTELAIFLWNSKCAGITWPFTSTLNLSTFWMHAHLQTIICKFGRDNNNNNNNKKAVLSQRWPRNAPYRPTWVPWKFSGLPDYAHGYYSQHFHGLLFRSTLWMFPQNLKSVALSVPEIIGGTQKNWAVPGYAHAPFSPKFFMGFYSDWSYKCTR